MIPSPNDEQFLPRTKKIFFDWGMASFPEQRKTFLTGAWLPSPNKEKLF